MKKIGYARVSTEEQNLCLQIDALRSIGCDEIFTDHGVSGVQATRPGLSKALRTLQPGDKLVVWRLDRLGRSLFHLIKIIEKLGKKGILFRSLNESIDTCSSGGKLLFHMMAALAEFERALISERTRAGMAAARAQGKHIGRPPALSSEQRQEAQQLIELGDFSLEEIATHYQVDRRTLKKLLKVENTPYSAAPPLVVQ